MYDRDTQRHQSSDSIYQSRTCQSISLIIAQRSVVMEFQPAIQSVFVPRGMISAWSLNSSIMFDNFFCPRWPTDYHMILARREWWNMSWSEKSSILSSFCLALQLLISIYRISPNKRAGRGGIKRTLTLVWFWWNSQCGLKNTLTLVGKIKKYN